MKSFKYIFSLLLLVILAQLKSQAQALEPYIPTPQTWDFVAHGNIPVGLYSGRLDLDIPLYHYKDKDFDIPIFIGYNSAGFVPSKPAGPVGLNWFLNYGGVITRRVRGVPDDMIFTCNVAAGMFFRAVSSYPHIPLNNIREIVIPPVQIATQYTNCNDKNVESVMVLDQTFTPTGFGKKFYETEPDLFDFNFLGHHGKFICDVNGEVHVYGCEGNGTYQVDISGAILSNNQIDKSKIVIKTGDGYTYTFGGNASCLENSYIYEEIASGPNIKLGVIVSWYLAEIKAPNGRKVSFEYEGPSLFPQAPNSGNNTSIDDALFVTTETLTELEGFIYTNLGALPLGTPNIDSYKQIVKSVFVKKISIDNGPTISFSNSLKTQKDGASIGGISFDNRTYKLDNITISNAGSNLRCVDFDYQYKGPNEQQLKRLFLNKLTLNNNEVYSFHYKNTNNLPDARTKGIDFWGFWNNRNNNSIIPIFDSSRFDRTRDVFYTDNKRMPSQAPGIFDAALLDSIVYPTGGYTRITYEPHTYTQRLERRSTYYFMPRLYRENGNAGGARVKMLEDINTDGTLEKKRTFTYESLSDELGGVLESWPLMASFGPASNGYPTLKMTSSGISANCFDEGYIAYPYVKETLLDGSYTAYNFTAYDNEAHCDVWEMSAQKSWDPYTLHWDVPVLNFYRNIERMPNSHAEERGKLWRKAHHNSNGHCVEEEIYEYDRIENQFVPGVSLSGDRVYSYLTLISPYLTKKMTKKTYGTNGQNPITTTIEYTYNSLGLKATESQTQSDGSYRGVTTRYVGDLITSHTYTPDVLGTRYRGDSKGLAKMFSLNMLGIPIEQLEWIRRDGVLKYSSATYTAYGVSTYNQHGVLNYDGIVKPTALYRFSASEPTSQYQMATFNLTSGSEYTTTVDSQLELEHSYNHDYKGDLIQHTDRSGLITSYLWGYSGLYPAVKAVGVTHDELLNTLSAQTHSSLNAVFTQLRSSLPNVHITGYTYIPHIGLSSEVSPDGLSTYYRYDSFGRLSRILDHNLNVVKQYRYHYANQAAGGDEEIVEQVQNPTPSWVATDECNCLKDSYGRNTGYESRGERDNNPYSLTYNTYRWQTQLSTQDSCDRPIIYITAVCNYVGVNCEVYVTASSSVGSNITLSMRAGGGLGRFQMTIPKGSSSVYKFFYVPGDKDLEVEDMSPTEDINYFYYIGTPEQHLPTYTIAASAAAGGIVSGGGNYNQGASVRLIATPSSGYSFDGWYEGATKVSSNTTYTFTTTANRTLQARFILVYTVTVSATTGGSATGGGTYATNSSVSVVASPNSGYIFDGWYEGAAKVSSSTTYTFTATANRSLQAMFTPVYTITVSATAGGSATGGGTYVQGTNISVAASPSSGYIFDGWYEGAAKVSSSTTYTFTATANRSLQARFTPVYTITVSATAGGSATGGGTYVRGTTISVHAIPNSGYLFDGWYDGSSRISTTATYAFTPGANTTLQARFIQGCTITLSATTGGGTGWGGIHAPNSSVSVVATPNSGYAFEGWYEGSTKVSSSATYTFTITANRTLQARFIQVKATVYISAYGSYDGPNCVVTVTASRAVASSVTVSLRGSGGLGRFKMTIPSGSSSISKTFYVPGDIDSIEIEEISPNEDSNYYYR